MQRLTIQLAQELKGKKIDTVFYGHEGKEYRETFVIGELSKDGRGRTTLLKSDGEPTYFFEYEFEPTFVCSDGDRFVSFEIAD
jgi:hypothetical protein